MSASQLNIVEGNELQNVESIRSFYNELTDARSHINRVHKSGDYLVITIMAAIGVCALNDEQWLKKRLKPPNGVPSHNTIGRLLTLIKPNLFQKCFQAWIQSLASPKEDKQANQIAIDKNSAQTLSRSKKWT